MFIFEVKVKHCYVVGIYVVALIKIAKSLRTIKPFDLQKDTDVTFQISCDNGSALVALNMSSQYSEGFPGINQPMMVSSTYTPNNPSTNTNPDSLVNPCAKFLLTIMVVSIFSTIRLATRKDFGGCTWHPIRATPLEQRRTRRSSCVRIKRSLKFARFQVRVYNFTTPITITVSFAQSPPINWVLFFVIFAACFIVLLVVAGLLWMIKVRIEAYRRNQRRIDEIEHVRRNIRYFLLTSFSSDGLKTVLISETRSIHALHFSRAQSHASIR